MTGATVAFHISSTVSLASSGVLIAERKAGTTVGDLYCDPSITDTDGVEEGLVLDRVRDDLHCVEKWFGLLHC